MASYSLVMMCLAPMIYITVWPCMTPKNAQSSAHADHLSDLCGLLARRFLA
jgi:hypothetical protein